MKPVHLVPTNESREIYDDEPRQHEPGAVKKRCHRLDRAIRLCAVMAFSTTRLTRPTAASFANL